MITKNKSVKYSKYGAFLLSNFENALQSRFLNCFTRGEIQNPTGSNAFHFLRM